MGATRVGAIGASGALVIAVAASLIIWSDPFGDRTGAGNARYDVERPSSEPPTGDRGGLAMAATACERWVSPTGDDAATGWENAPWATLEHAVEAVPSIGCTVWFEDGIYRGINEIDRRFGGRTVLRAVNEYGAILQSRRMVLDIRGAASLMTFRGFQIRQEAGGSGVAVYISGDGADEPAPHRITFMDNIIHDTFAEDLMKIRSRANAITVRGNVFYNQGSNEQHIDVNSVWNVVIEENVLFNAFEESERSPDGTTKHFIVVKDSNQGEDGLRGSERITIQRNVFLNWQGEQSSYLGIGNDGKAYHEASGVRILNNLMIGNGPDRLNAPLTVYGARDVEFTNNTVVGNMPADTFAFEVDRKGENPRNRDIRFRNNIWLDPSGTMESFSDGSQANTINLVLQNNLYWNGGAQIPAGDLVSPLRHDAQPLVSAPMLPAFVGPIVLPVWEGSSFRSGERSIHAEFVRVVETYGRIPSESPASGRALPTPATARDILGRLRDAYPDLGAFEADA